MPILKIKINVKISIQKYPLIHIQSFLRFFIFAKIDSSKIVYEYINTLYIFFCNSKYTFLFSHNILCN